MENNNICKQHLPKNLEKMNFNAAGIDIGSEFHYVAVPEGRDEVSVRSFKSFTADLYKLADWLKQCKIDTVVMESTGVYWITLFQVLESKGFEVLLVNAQHVRNVPGRKTDVKDCQWLQELHTYGLLRGSFQPDNKIRILRTYLRQRDTLVQESSSHIQHMQKALTLMNVKLHNVISDITGVSGMNIIRGIISGEDNPAELVKLCVTRLKNSPEIIKKSLEGTYRDEHVFLLKQAVELYDFYQKKIIECEKNIEELIKSFESNTEQKVEVNDENTLPTGNKKKKKRIENKEMHAQLIRITGVDLTQIDGLNTTSVMTLIGEVGLDMSKWKTEKHFTSWLGLAPNNKISGGRVLSRRTMKVKSRASNTFRMAAYTLYNSNSYLGAVYRRLRFRLGPAKANMALARRIAVLFYDMLKNGKNYVDYGCEFYDIQQKNRKLKSLRKSAKILGMELVPITA